MEAGTEVTTRLATLSLLLPPKSSTLDAEGLHDSQVITWGHTATAGEHPDDADDANNASGANDNDDDYEIFLNHVIYTYVNLYLSAQKSGRSEFSLTPEEIYETLQYRFSTLYTSTFSPNDSAPPSGNPALSSASFNVNPAASNNKRRRQDDDSPGRGRRSRLSRASTRTAKPEPGRPFACPFFYGEREENGTCLGFALSRISDVRMHINRKHKQALHCPICGIVFEGDTNGSRHNRHLIERACQGTQYSPPPGASSDQLLAIAEHAKNRTARTEEARWYEIWDIVFPGKQRPPTPYVPHSHLTEILVDASRRIVEDGTANAIATELLLPPGSVDTIINRFINYVDSTANNSPTSLTTRASGVDGTGLINATQTLQPPVPLHARQLTQTPAWSTVQQPPSLVGSSQPTLSSNTSGSSAPAPGGWMPLLCPDMPISMSSSYNFCPGLGLDPPQTGPLQDEEFSRGLGYDMEDPCYVDWDSLLNNADNQEDA